MADLLEFALMGLGESSDSRNHRWFRAVMGIAAGAALIGATGYGLYWMFS